MIAPLLLALASAQAVAPETPDSPPAAVLMTFDSTGAEQTRIVRGTANHATGRPITADDPVRVASVSKLVVALAAMRLSEQRRIDLDADVSRYLGWTLRNPAHPQRPITLAQLLSHRSGLSADFDYLLPFDADLATVLADPAAWDAARRPGGAFSYANINTIVVAAALEGATGQRFDRLMAGLVFRPLRIDACFNWMGCSDAVMDRAITLYRPNGDVAREEPVNGSRPACPIAPAGDGSCDFDRYRLAHNTQAFSPQGGLRISARGLARIGQLLLREDERLLSSRVRRRWLGSLRAVEPAGSEGGLLCDYGFALQSMGPGRAGCRADPLGDGVRRIGHSGDAYSLRSGLFVAPTEGVGVVWFVTQVPESAPPGERSAYSAEEEAMFAQAGMVGPRPTRR